MPFIFVKMDIYYFYNEEQIAIHLCINIEYVYITEIYIQIQSCVYMYIYSLHLLIDISLT